MSYYQPSQQMFKTVFRLFIGMALILSQGCSVKIPSDPELTTIDNSYLPTPDISMSIEGLSNCTTSPDTTIHLNSNEPVVILVHGCSGSAARFRALAQVFAFHGQQTICFNYNDRDSLIKSSKELIHALESLSTKIDTHQITVIGHSQGGLIARKALVQDRKDSLQINNLSLSLVTISSPFAGISAADHCVSLTARLLTFGLAVPFCKILSGDKWYEITQPSPFIQQPGELLEQVEAHIKIVTDETASCRRYNDNGICVEDDFVFSVNEQYFEHVDASSHVENIEVSAGHVEIVGDYRVPPEKLIPLMQSKGIMRDTPLARQKDLSDLLTLLY